MTNDSLNMRAFSLGYAMKCIHACVKLFNCLVSLIECEQECADELKAGKQAETFAYATIGKLRETEKLLYEFK